MYCFFTTKLTLFEKGLLFCGNRDACGKPEAAYVGLGTPIHIKMAVIFRNWSFIAIVIN